MIVENKSTPIFGNVQEVQTFGVKSNNKAYQILSDSLYTYKIRAFIRELSCNAVDGHKELFRQTGSAPKHFDVETPSMISMQWRIRDYGIGLDDRGIQIFSTYFESTKELNPDDIGGFGLGSKSPFAYTKSLSISSYHEGMKRVYSVFVQDGIPKLTKIYEEKTDEPSGVEIIVPIKESDIAKVHSEMKYVYATFDKSGYYPNILDSNFELYNYKDKTDEMNYIFNSGIYAVCGGVSYPIPSEYYRKTLVNKIATGPTFIDFDISSVDPAPSREQLQMNDKTNEAIILKFEELDNKILEGVTKIISDNKDNIFEIYKQIHEIDSTAEKSFDGLVMDSSYTGRTIWNHIDQNDDYKVNGKHLREYAIEYGTFAGPYAKALLKYSNKINKKNKHFCRLKTAMNTEKLKIFKNKSYWDSDLVYDTSSMQLGLEYHESEKHFVFMDFNDTKHIKKLKSLLAIGVIPRCSTNMFAFNIGTKTTSAEVSEGGRINVTYSEIAKADKNIDITVYDLLMGAAEEFKSKCYKVTTYNVDELCIEHKEALDKHKAELAEQEKTERDSKPAIDRKGIPNAFKYEKTETASFRTTAAEVETLSGYYIITKDGMCFDGDSENYKFVSISKTDITMFLKHVADKSKAVVYQLQMPMFKAAERNPNLIRITAADVEKMFHDLKDKCIKEENMEVVYNLHNFNIPNKCKSIKNYFDSLKQVGKMHDEIHYVIRSSQIYGVNVEVNNAINALKTEINKKFSQKIDSFTNANPLITPLISNNYTLCDRTVKAINDSVIIPPSEKE